MKKYLKFFETLATVALVVAMIYAMSSGIIEHTREVDNAALTGVYVNLR